MCQTCSIPGGETVLHLVNKDLEPEKAKHFKNMGGRYVFAEDPLDPNAKDAMQNAKPIVGMHVSAEVWERIFGQKE